jgi:S-adenosylmethionine decarboxylase
VSPEKSFPAVTDPLTGPGASIPGLHLIADFWSAETALLRHFEPVKRLFDREIVAFGLSKIGEVYHNFPEGGFTGVVCLAESHLSIHTWPEYGKVTFDVFLSNHTRCNDVATRHIYEATLALFKARQVILNELKR